MAVDELELWALRVNTEEFIAQSPMSIVIWRPIYTTPTAGGALSQETRTLTAQKFHLTHAPATEEFRTGGRFTGMVGTLIGRYDADVERGDYFTYEGTRYTVGSVDRTSHYQTIATVYSGQ